jgi:hypothetical protein
VLERGSAVGLTGHERAVDSGEREARELVRDRASRIVAERGRDLRPQEIERVFAYPADDSLYLSLTRGGGCAAKPISRRRKSGWRSSVPTAADTTLGQVLCGAPGRPHAGEAHRTRRCPEAA